ncbi:MAG: glycoside hydrolase family protein [Verrucomicrobiae bacterium]
MAATVAAVFPAATGILPASPRSRVKRGLGITTNEASQWREKLKASGARWFYSWGSMPPENIPAAIEFVPMVWGGKPDDSFTKLGERLRTAGYQQLLGLNEPDNKEQSNVTVEDALSLWPKLMDTGLRLGCPACVHPDGEWMKAFMKGVEERHLRVDFVTVHSYGGLSVDAFMNQLASVHKLFNRPIWITEFAVGDWEAKTRADNRYNPGQIMKFVEQVLPRLEGCDFVERYAWFPADPDNKALGSSALFNEDGSLTPVGQAYRSI